MLLRVCSPALNQIFKELPGEVKIFQLYLYNYVNATRAVIGPFP